MELKGLPRFAAYYLGWITFVYAAHGIAAFPAQEWLIELLVSIVLLLPALSAVRFGFTPTIARTIALALLAHAGWDALHWPGGPMATPIDPRIPRFEPIADLLLGIGVLVISSRSLKPRTDLPLR
ncbi:MAG: hypothetical protein NDJ90_15065 [Oligoflexia bacterium]|nr:hypothetical protein [Oligoflexia bacterium]